MKTAIVTGGTSGLGLAAAQILAAKGLRVYALSRHGAPVPGVTSLACDITDADAVERTVAAIEAEAGRIDLVVNNAGFGISGAVECTTPEEARRLFDVDFFGVVNVNHAVLPRGAPPPDEAAVCHWTTVQCGSSAEQAPAVQARLVDRIPALCRVRRG